MLEKDVIEGAAVLSEMLIKHGKGFRTQWAAVCRIFGFDPGTTVAIHATAVDKEVQPIQRPTNPPTPPRPKPNNEEDDIDPIEEVAPKQKPIKKK